MDILKEGSNMKYKIGDKVRIRKDLVVGTFYGGCLFVPEMQDLVGETTYITGVFKDGRCYRIHSSTKYWTAKMFENKSMGTDKRVIIDSDGGEVAAIDLGTGKRGVARCHPDDAFDFYIGAKIALERLEETEKPYGWLKVEGVYFIPNITYERLYEVCVYGANEIDKRYMKHGIVFQTKEEAIECAKKMLAAVKKEG